MLSSCAEPAARTQAQGGLEPGRPTPGRDSLSRRVVESGAPVLRVASNLQVDRIRERAGDDFYRLRRLPVTDAEGRARLGRVGRAGPTGATPGPTPRATSKAATKAL